MLKTYISRINKKDILVFTVIIFSGLILYLSLNHKVNFTFLKNSERKDVLTPKITGKEGMSIPPFTILLADSSIIDTIVTYSPNKSTVLFYFSPYCPFCQAEIKEITSNMQKLKDIQFFLLTPFSFNEMKTFYKENELRKYDNIKTGIDMTYFLSSYFKINTVPFVAIYDKNDKLKAAFAGGISANQIITVLRKK